MQATIKLLLLLVLLSPLFPEGYKSSQKLRLSREDYNKIFSLLVMTHSLYPGFYPQNYLSGSSHEKDKGNLHRLPFFTLCHPALRYILINKYFYWEDILFDETEKNSKPSYEPVYNAQKKKDHTSYYSTAKRGR